MPAGDLEGVARRYCADRGLEFLAPVGEGAFKETFEARTSPGLRVALKLYKAKFVTGREKREVRSMLRCDHPNIARLVSVDAFVSGGQTYITIIEEFLPGGTLAERISLTRAQCLSIGRQLVDALGHIAKLNLVHRDIKPENIMFRADGKTPVLTDFGVVRDLSDSSLTPTWAPRGPGTPLFSSPEQLNNEKELIDWRSDQFALGVVLASMTFKAHPYAAPGMTNAEVVGQVASRIGPVAEFGEFTRAANLPVLLRMVEPWPVARYRKPQLLQQAWGDQEG